MKQIQKFENLGQALLNGGVVTAIFNMFKGRFTFAAIVFSIVGIYGWLHLGRDLTSFALFITPIQALLGAKSFHEDWLAYKHRQLDIQCGNKDVDQSASS